MESLLIFRILLKTHGDYKMSKNSDPEVYCSTGIAVCKDIDTRQMCICGGCAVWQDYDLISREPAYYFCKNGRAR